MPRTTSRNASQQQMFQGDAAIHAAQSLLRDERKFMLDIQACHIKATMLAEHLKQSSNNTCATVAALLAEDESGGENLDFINTLRDDVKNVTRRHVQQSRDVEVFMAAVQNVAQELIASRNDNTDDDDSISNYEQMINEKIVQIQAQKEAQGEWVDVEHESLYRNILKCLGEKGKNQKGNGDDDELEMLSDDEAEQSEGDMIRKLKCPITGMFLEDPVRNKVCGHVYSRQGIEAMFSQRNYNCPLPGCSNRRMSQDQLEDDLHMAEKVRRFKRRQAQLQAAQSQHMYDDEEENVNIID